MRRGRLSSGGLRRWGLRSRRLSGRGLACHRGRCRRRGGWLDSRRSRRGRGGSRPNLLHLLIQGAQMLVHAAGMLFHAAQLLVLATHLLVQGAELLQAPNLLIHGSKGLVPAPNVLVQVPQILV